MSATAQMRSLIVEDEREELQTGSGDGHHESAQCQTQSQIDDYDAKVELLRAAFRNLSTLWEPGDGEQFAWVFTELDDLEQKLDRISKDELVRSLKHLYKRIAYAKRGGCMDIIVDVPKRVLVSRGEHQAKIVSVSQPEPNKFDPSKQTVKIVFEITKGKYKGQRLSKYYTLSLGSKSALGQLWRRLIGEPEEQVNLAHLIDKAVAIFITHKQGEDGDYAVVQDVFAPEESPFEGGEADA